VSAAPRDDRSHLLSNWSLRDTDRPRLFAIAGALIAPRPPC
jgi:hypothetical protein